MAAQIQFDISAFRTLFLAFADTTAYPDALLTAYWGLAGAYITKNPYCSNFGDIAQQTYALQLMTAHLTFVLSLAAQGETPGVELSATIDKISVTNMPPPAPNAWQYWLQTSPYGSQLLALLEVASAGGFFYNGFPVASAFRR